MQSDTQPRPARLRCRRYTMASALAHITIQVRASADVGLQDLTPPRGGRFYGQLTDCDPATVAFEMPVELCFRRIHDGEGIMNYFWKFRPAT